ncbi:MAG TPA: RNA polymerase sigma factor [Ktedonobacterales bacterium]
MATPLPHAVARPVAGSATTQDVEVAEFVHISNEDFERRLVMAASRLARIARLRGVPADDAEDIVQQTLLESWRALDRLRDPSRFDAWLDAICRHLCQRYLRAQRSTRSATPLSALAEAEEAEQAITDMAGSNGFDLDDALDREDRERLLAQALGYLPPATRAAVEACYLADLPSGEAALRLGLSINALEVRLHRARRQLRALFSGPLSTEAATLGIFLPGEVSEGWRESREWCLFCGQRRLRGIFEPQPDGLTILRLRCPDCSPRYDIDIERSARLRELRHLRSFRPAVRRYREAQITYSQALHASGWQACPTCGGRVHLRCAHPGDAESVGERWYAVITCPRCGPIHTWWAGVAVWSTPDSAAHGLRWLEDHPRAQFGPETLASYDGRSALRSQLVDVVTGQTVTLFTDPETPRLLGLHEE